VRRLVLDREVVDGRLRVLDLVSNHAGERTTELRIVGVEPGLDLLPMLIVAAEDDRLADPVASGHLVTARHQRLKHLVDRVGVEHHLLTASEATKSGTSPSSSHSRESRSSFSASDRSL
jgi:hypothetical protein